MTEENQEQKIVEDIVEEKQEEPKSDKTALVVSKATAEKLMKLKNLGDSYEDVILRLIEKPN
jgi:hypothetical protein